VFTRRRTIGKAPRDSQTKPVKMPTAKVSGVPALAKAGRLAPSAHMTTAAPSLILRNPSAKHQTTYILLAHMSPVQTEYSPATREEPWESVNGASVSAEPTGGGLSPNATAGGPALWG